MRKRLQGAKSSLASVNSTAQSITSKWLKIPTTTFHKQVKDTVIRKSMCKARTNQRNEMGEEKATQQNTKNKGP